MRTFGRLNPGLEKLTPVTLCLAIVLAIGDVSRLYARDVTFLHISDQHYGAKSFDPNVLNATIDAMNALPGTPYPEKGGGKVQRPMGVILTGDLTDGGSVEQWNAFAADWGLVGGDARLDYPVYEGAGNHDGPPSTTAGEKGHVRRMIGQRNQRRPHVVNVSANGLHYSWDWQDVHFVQLNEYAGLDDTTRYPGNVPYGRKAQAYGNPAQESLQFLAQDLANQVGDSDRPVVLCQHYGFDSFAFRPWGDERAWWTEEHALRLWETIEGYNVIAILGGHDGSEAVVDWNGIVNYHMDDSVRFRVYRITDEQMTVMQRNSKTSQWETINTQPVSVNAALPSQLVQGPYLVCSGDPTRMTIRWRCDSNPQCELKWGNVYFRYEAGEADIEPYDSERHLYRYTMTDLKPNTRYCYQLKIGEKYAPGMFYTPPDSNGTKVKFLAWNATASDEATAKAILDRLYADPAYHTFLLPVGMRGRGFFAAGPDDASMRHMLSRLPIAAPASRIRRAQPSNGESAAGDIGLRQYGYSFDYGPIHVVMLNSASEYGPNSDGYRWLRSDLEDTTKDWKVVASYTRGATNQPGDLEVDDSLMALWRAHGVDLCLCNPGEDYVRTGIDGVQLLLAGTGSQRPGDTDQSQRTVIAVSGAAYYAIGVEGGTLTLEALDEAGKRVDAFSMQDNEGTNDGVRTE